MKDFVFITGNQRKADYLAMWLGHPVKHQKIELEEVQSLDLSKVVEDKARRAWEVAGRPVLVEDIALTFHALGQLPGTLIRWFLEEIGTEGLCRMMRGYDDKRATAAILYGHFDGQKLHTFGAEVAGTVAPEPRSVEAEGWKSNFGWNSVFIPNGSDKTYAQMPDEELAKFGHRRLAVLKLKAYLEGKAHSISLTE